MLTCRSAVGWTTLPPLLNGRSLIINNTERYPPDTMAATRWLGNRQRRLWSERTEVAVTGANGGPVQTVNATVEIPANDPIEAARVYQKLMSGD